MCFQSYDKILEGSTPIFNGGSPKKSLQSDIFFAWGLEYFDMLQLTCPCLRRSYQLSVSW